MAISTPWRPMTDALPVVSTAGALTASFAGDGTLSIQVPFSADDSTILVAASHPHSRYWYQGVESDGTALTTSMEGFDAAWRSCGDTAWTLSLGRITQNGVVLYPLRSKGSSTYVRDLDTYFCDDRRRYQPSAGSFAHSGISMEILPRYTERQYNLSLLVTPAEDRYLEQLACRLEDFRPAANGDIPYYNVVVRCPDSMEQPLGVSFHDAASDQPAQLLFPGEPVDDFAHSHCIRAEVPADALRSLTGSHVLTCVIGREGELLLRCPVRLADAALATQLQSDWEFHPLQAAGENQLYLSVTADHQLMLDAASELPGTQRSDCAALQDYLNSADCHPDYAVTALCVSGGDWRWTLRFPNLNVCEMDEAVLRLEKLKSSLRIDCPLTDLTPEGNGCLATADLSALPAAVENCLAADWFPVLALRKGNRFWYLPLLDPVHTSFESKAPRSQFSLIPDDDRIVVGGMDFAGRTLECYTFWARKYDNRMCLRTSDQALRHMAAFACRADWAKLHFGRLTARIRCPKISGKWVGVVLSHRYKLEADRKDYFIPCTALKDCGSYWEMTIRVNVHKLTFAPLYWDIRAVYEQDGIQFWSPVRSPMRTGKAADLLKQEGIKGLFFGESAVLNKDQQLFLYRTMINRFALVCQERTPYSGFLFRLKERFAFLLYLLFRKQLKKQSIMLTYEKYCCMAQDNGFYFFKHCMDNHLEEKLKRKIYFVIDKKSVDYQKNLLPYQDHVIQFMSLRHMVYLLAARLLVSSDSKAHAYAWRCKESILQPYIEKNVKLVFLQHGVIALKKVEFFRSGTNVVDLFVTSNDQEHDIIINELGYQPQEVIITGLTRWDVLEDHSAQAKKKTILIMPTWRNWLEEVSDESFRASDYYQNYMQLLNSPRLEEYLEQNDLYLDFYIHPKFREYLSNFSISADRVRLIPFGSEPLNLLMMDCSLLITDYSSVCWDVFYQAKPIIFYQFDVDKYNETQGAYIDLEHDLFGDRAVNNDQLFALMEEYAANGFRLKPEYAEMRQRMYKYIDRNNSQRVIDEIRKRNW